MPNTTYNPLLGPDNEAVIIINGVKLTHAQSMAVRVALTSFQMQMSEPQNLGTDEQAMNIAKGYLAQSNAVIQLISDGAQFSDG